MASPQVPRYGRCFRRESAELVEAGTADPRYRRTYGYQELRTPMFEHTELFKGEWETTDIVEKEMYTFTDRAAAVLLPEGTAPVVRAYLEHKWGRGRCL